MRCFSKSRREAWILRASNLAISTPLAKQNPNDTIYRVLTLHIINMEVIICEMEKADLQGRCKRLSTPFVEPL